MLAGIPAVLVAVTKPGIAAITFDAYLLFLGALALLTLTRLTTGLAGTAEASELDELLQPRRRRRRRREERRQLTELARMEREVSLAATAAADVHVRLRRTARTIAGYRLLSRHGVDLDEQPERARALLAEPTWDLVRPDRPEPSDRLGPGLRPAELREIVRQLQAL